MKRILNALETLACLALLTGPAIAAEKSAGPPVQPNNVTDIAKMVWPAESRHGTISKIDSARRIITMKDTAGVPFDFVVEPSTKITSGGKDVRFGDLVAAEKVTIQCKPEVRTDIAEKIQVGG